MIGSLEISAVVEWPFGGRRATLTGVVVQDLGNKVKVQEDGGSLQELPKGWLKRFWISTYYRKWRQV